MKQPIIKVDNVSKEFAVGDKKIRIIKEVSLDVFPGEFVMIYGPSGCGKSTFLSIMNGWIAPTIGTVTVKGEDLYKKTEDDRSRMKQHEISLMNQSSDWVKSLSVIDNICMPYLLAGKFKSAARKRAMTLLQMLHLERYAFYRPMDLSGGQQQRISFLRSLINNPEIIMADEPTGNLDTSSTAVIMELFSKINHDLGRTIIMVTHNMDLLRNASKSVNIIDGRIVSVNENKDFEMNEKIEAKDVLEIGFKNIVKDTSEEEEEERERSKVG